MQFQDPKEMSISILTEVLLTGRKEHFTQNLKKRKSLEKMDQSRGVDAEDNCWKMPFTNCHQINTTF